jgi:hypothetical protein
MDCAFINQMKSISIARDYSETPIGRYLDDSDFNGEKFRETILRDALSEGELEVDLDGVEGFGSSFLEEAFGGLVRKGYFVKQELHQKLKIKCTEERLMKYVPLIWKHIDEAQVESDTNHSTP